MNFQPLFFALCAGLLACGCASSRPKGTNVEVYRPPASGSVATALPITIRSGRVPLLTIKDGQRLYGTLQPAVYHLTALSADPYSVSDFQGRFWGSPVFELKVEEGRFYKLEVVPAEAMNVGWAIRLAPD